MLHNVRILISLIIIGMVNSVTVAQNNSIGIMGGYQKGALFNYTTTDYEAKYPVNNGTSFSLFYEDKIDSSRFRVELQYVHQNVGMEIKNNTGYISSFYKNMDYSFRLLNLNLNYSFCLVEEKSVGIYCVFGPTFFYTLTTHVHGNGWEFYYQPQTDSSGNAVNMLLSRNWTKNEKNTKDIAKFNYGLDVGIDLTFPLKKSGVDIILQNKYTFFLNNITAPQKELHYTSLFIGKLSLGLRYRFKSRN